MSKNKGSVGEKSPVFGIVNPSKSSARNLPWDKTLLFQFCIEYCPFIHHFQVLRNFKFMLKNVECVTGLGMFLNQLSCM